MEFVDGKKGEEVWNKYIVKCKNVCMEIKISCGFMNHL